MVADDFVVVLGAILPKDYRVIYERRRVWVGLRPTHMTQEQRQAIAKHFTWHAGHQAYGQKAEAELSIPYIKRAILKAAGMKAQE